MSRPRFSSAKDTEINRRQGCLGPLNMPFGSGVRRGIVGGQRPFSEGSIVIGVGPEDTRFAPEGP